MRKYLGLEGALNIDVPINLWVQSIEIYLGCLFDFEMPFMLPCPLPW